MIGWMMMKYLDAPQQPVAVRIVDPEAAVREPLAVHEVGEAHAAAGIGEGGLEHRGALGVASRDPVLAARPDAEEAAPIGVEQATEHRPAVEVRQTAPVDRAVGSDQRRRMGVPDQRVVRDRPVIRTRPCHAKALPAVR